MSDVFLADTHPLVFWADDRPKKLGRKARAAFEAMEAGRAAIYVPAMVCLEVALLARAGLIRVEPGLAEWWRSIESQYLLMVENTHEDVLNAFRLAWDHVDHFDRLIAQTALRMGLPLITADHAITEWGGVEVIW